MFDSRSTFIKIGGYVIVGFFVLIIIISFGMPDFMSRIGGMDKSTVAVINGEKVSYLDFLRYRDLLAGRIKDVNSREIQQFILENIIRYRLQLQKARDLGVTVSDDRVKYFIKRNPMFRGENGTFNDVYLTRFLDHYHMSLTDYYVMVREELMNSEMIQMIRMGVGVSPGEVRDQLAIDTSRIQIKYGFVSTAELKNRMGGRLAVTDEEVEREIKTNRAEIKDPKTDKERMRSKLADRKFDSLRREIIAKIDRLSLEGGSFENAVAVLGGRVQLSAVFRIGEPVREASGKGGILYSISESPLFVSDCLAIRQGGTSRVIQSFDGLYVFTPVQKAISFTEPPQAQYGSVESRLLGERTNDVYIAMMTSFMEKSKVRRNPDFNK